MIFFQKKYLLLFCVDMSFIVGLPYVLKIMHAPFSLPLANLFKVTFMNAK